MVMVEKPLWPDLIELVDRIEQGIPLLLSFIGSDLVSWSRKKYKRFESEQAGR